MQTLTFTRPFSSSTSSTVPLKLVNGPSATRTCSPISNRTAGRGALHALRALLHDALGLGIADRAGRVLVPRKPVTFGVSLTRCQVSSVRSIFTST